MVQELLSSSGLSACLRSQTNNQWEDVCSNLAYIPVAYSEISIDYQLSYWAGLDGQGEVADLSLLLFHDNKTCGLWPISVKWEGGAAIIGSNGGELEPPIFIKGLSRKSEGQIVNRCLDFINLLAQKLGVASLRCVDGYSGRSSLSTWHHQLFLKGATSNLHHELFVDLNLNLAGIKANIRKSYKSLINRGCEIWNVNILQNCCQNVWDEYRDLHYQVSGRITRNMDSWERQHEAIGRGSAFLVYLRDSDERMVGGGLFYCTRDEGLYAVGAYDRALFDKPLGHVVQYRAIEVMKERGMRWYRIGQRPYKGDLPNPTNKELAIADFKQGFATDLFPRYLIDIEIPS